MRAAKVALNTGRTLLRRTRGQGVRQVIDGVFVGCASSDSFPLRRADDATILEGADMLVAAIDSSLWLVGAPRPCWPAFGNAFERRARWTRRPRSYRRGVETRCRCVPTSGDPSMGAD